VYNLRVTNPPLIIPRSPDVSTSCTKHLACADLISFHGQRRWRPGNTHSSILWLLEGQGWPVVALHQLAVVIATIPLSAAGWDGEKTDDGSRKVSEGCKPTIHIKGCSVYACLPPANFIFLAIARHNPPFSFLHLDPQLSWTKQLKHFYKSTLLFLYTRPSNMKITSLFVSGAALFPGTTLAAVAKINYYFNVAGEFNCGGIPETLALSHSCSMVTAQIPFLSKPPVAYSASDLGGCKCM
jgi:hypothetical protein